MAIDDLLERIKEIGVDGPMSLYRMVSDCIDPQRKAFTYTALNAPELYRSYNRAARQPSEMNFRVIMCGRETIDINAMQENSVETRACTANGVDATLLASREMRLLPDNTDNYETPVSDWYVIAVFDTNSNLLFAYGGDSAEQASAIIEDLCVVEEDHTAMYEGFEQDAPEELDFAENHHPKEVGRNV